MKKNFKLLLKIFLVLLVIAYTSLLFVEYFRYRNDKPMMIVLKEKVKNYDDGNVHIYYGLGYKSIDYQRKSIYGKQFGHIFIREMTAEDE